MEPGQGTWKDSSTLPGQPSKRNAHGHGAWTGKGHLHGQEIWSNNRT